MSTDRRNPPMPATQMRQRATDPTAARDRAIEAILPALAAGGSVRGTARGVVAALLENPEVLRALAGAPDELDRLREIERRALDVNGDPNSSNEAVEVSRYILGES